MTGLRDTGNSPGYEHAACEHEWRLFKQDVVDYDRQSGAATFLRTRAFYCVRCREVVTDTDKERTYER